MKWWTRDWKDIDGLFMNPVVLDVNFLSPNNTDGTVLKKEKKAVVYKGKPQQVGTRTSLQNQEEVDQTTDCHGYLLLGYSENRIKELICIQIWKRKQLMGHLFFDMICNWLNLFAFCLSYVLARADWRNHNVGTLVCKCLRPNKQNKTYFSHGLLPKQPKWEEEPALWEQPRSLHNFCSRWSCWKWFSFSIMCPKYND